MSAEESRKAFEAWFSESYLYKCGASELDDLLYVWQTAIRWMQSQQPSVYGDLKTVSDILQDFHGDTVWQQAQSAVAMIDELRGQQEWRSMDSAPRDEREFLLLVRNADPEVFVASWDKRSQTWETNDGLIPRRRCWGWLPLPPLPKEKT